MFYHDEDECAPCGYSISIKGDEFSYWQSTEYGVSPDSDGLRNALPPSLAGQCNNILLASIDIDEMEEEGVDGMLIYPDEAYDLDDRVFNVQNYIPDVKKDKESIFIWHIYGGFITGVDFPVRDFFDGELCTPLRIDFNDDGVVDEYATDSEILVVVGG